MVGGNFGDFCELSLNQKERKIPYFAAKRQSVCRAGPLLIQTRLSSEKHNFYSVNKNLSTFNIQLPTLFCTFAAVCK